MFLLYETTLFQKSSFHFLGLFLNTYRSILFLFLFPKRFKIDFKNAPKNNTFPISFFWNFWTILARKMAPKCIQKSFKNRPGGLERAGEAPGGLLDPSREWFWTFFVNFKIIVDRFSPIFPNFCVDFSSTFLRLFWDFSALFLHCFCALSALFLRSSCTLPALCLHSFCTLPALRCAFPALGCASLRLAAPCCAFLRNLLRFTATLRNLLTFSTRYFLDF